MTKKLSRKQRDWVMRRDGQKCRFPVWVGNHWAFCGRTKDLHCHHIIPQGAMMKWMPDKPRHTPNNLIIVCVGHHNMIHPDMHRSKMEYPHSKNSAYSRAFKVREALSDYGDVYWDARWDSLMNKVVQRLTGKYVNKNPEDPFPY